MSRRGRGNTATVIDWLALSKWKWCALGQPADNARESTVALAPNSTPASAPVGFRLLI
jgi:hypothetical protein